MEAKEKTMQEVNVRVAVRVRPLLPKEKVGGEDMCVRILPATNQLILGKDRAFTFDDVLAPKTSQDDAYKLCVENLVKSIFDGYNATVFAYGQTGSGKTYTIGGGHISSLTEDEYGIIPRALKQMFDIMQVDKSVRYSVKVSYIEIYKEELQDLLDLDTSSKDLHVREDDKGNTVVIGHKEVDCETLDDVMSLLVSGSAVRHTGSTQMNEHSSRSHSIFTVIIGQEWSEGDIMAGKRKQDEADEPLDDHMTHNMVGKFHFVDLAGSERAHKTGNVGDRFKESVHINSGLLALGNVISALGDPKKKSTHIPYRESKITRLLKDSLGGNAKTLMVCCISPSSTNFDESLNALKYANRARNIKNLPIVNRDIQSIRFEEMQTEIKALREELARQRTTMLSNGPDLDPQKTARYAGEIKKLEDQMARLQTECGNYKLIAEEAYRQLILIQGKDFLSKSQDIRLKDWLDLMEEIKNKVPGTLNKQDWESETIKTLQKELKKAKEDLRSDEDIFAEKAKELSSHKARIEELESMVEQREHGMIQADEKLQSQEQQLIEQNMKIEELQKALKPEQNVSSLKSVDTETTTDRLTEVTLIGDSKDLSTDAVIASAPVTSRQNRPKSVPIHLHRQPGDMQRYSQLRPPSRNIKTSPALFTLERVMKSFRARSQLLVSRLEDSDEVLHLEFSDEGGEASPDSDEDGLSKEVEKLYQPGESLASIREGTFVRKGTFRVKKGEKEENKENKLPEIKISSDGSGKALGLVNGELGVDVGRSTEVQKKIKEAQLKMQQSNQKIRDLGINIRMKEQLIRELVKTGKDAEQMNKQYADKVTALEKEREHVKQELLETQKALQGIEIKEQQETADKQKLQCEYKKKVEAAKAKMSALRRKQQETEKIANIANQNDKKIGDLELAVDRMKQQQERLHKKLKDESDKKAKFEHELQKELQRVTELEIKNEQQQKILRRKNEEIASAKRRLRNGSAAGSLPPIHIEDHDKIEEQKKWLDCEVEKIVQQKREVEHLQEELKKRESIIAKKEAMLAEKSELEIKRLRSSQVVNKSLVAVSSKLEVVERKLEEKGRELIHTPENRSEMIKEEMDKLQQVRDKLQKQRGLLDVKLHEGSLLSASEERRLIELDEGIEALDAAIEYKTEVIQSRQLEVRHSQALAHSEDNLMNRLNSLTSQDTKSLLTKYFDKVVSLREQERKISLHSSEMEVKLDEQERLIHDLQGALQQASVEVDRRLTTQQKEYEQKIQLLMHQLMESGSNSAPVAGDPSLELRVSQLEKDLYYYKKTSRDLKRRLRDYVSSGTIPAQEVDLRASIQSSAGDMFPEPNIHNSHPNHNRESHSARSRDIRSSGDRLREDGSRPTSAKTVQPAAGITPVKISRKDLRLMTEAEVHMRRSNLKESVNSQPLQDSLDPGGNNPWG